MLAELLLRVSEVVGNADGETLQWHFHLHVVGEVLAVCVTFNIQFAAVSNRCHGRKGKCQLVVEECFRNVGCQ